MTTIGSRTGRRQDGFSLAEVLVALGILAGALISVAGLLVVGHRLVHSGRGSSLALAVARDILEVCAGRSFAQVHAGFGCDPTESTCTVGLDDPTLAPWRGRLAEELHDGQLEVSIESVESGGVPLRESRALRIRVSIFWREGRRERTIRLIAVRT
jgi:hypothetical protein